MSDQISAADVDLLRAAARAGDVKVQYKLGLLLKLYPELGAPGEFAQWLSQAAERGSGDACWELAEVFLDSGGAKRDYQRAHAIMMLGATLANEKCLQQLGVMYLTGTGVAADPALGFNYTLRAAKLGDHDAQYGAGICCMRGVGTERDLEQARVWLTQAAQSGDSRATSALSQIGQTAGGG